MKEEVLISLDKSYFSEKEKTLLQVGALSASLFQYRSGIHAVRLRNPDGHIILLPFKGQQIWDAVFNRRSLKMKTMLDEPIQTDFFLNSYSCLMMHCGALRMGCPGPDDTHPLHGELPYVDYHSAEIVLGEDEEGKYIGVAGTYEHKPAFAPNYCARPLIKLYENSDILAISIEIQNLLQQAMELMYMCHLNFRIGDKSSIVQTLGWSAEDMVLSIAHLHEQDKLSKSKLELLDRLKQEPALTQTLDRKDVYDPEINFFLGRPKVDENGWAHYLQILNDGSGNYVSYQPVVLDHAVRWIWKNEDYDVLGLVLPSTCDPEGYIREKAKGNVKEIPGGESATFTIKAGYLDSERTETMRKFIENNRGPNVFNEQN
jgi:hypothetical protein